MFCQSLGNAQTTSRLHYPPEIYFLSSKTWNICLEYKLYSYLKCSSFTHAVPFNSILWRLKYIVASLQSNTMPTPTQTCMHIHKHAHTCMPEAIVPKSAQPSFDCALVRHSFQAEQKDDLPFTRTDKSICILWLRRSCHARAEMGYHVPTIMDSSHRRNHHRNWSNALLVSKILIAIYTACYD